MIRAMIVGLVAGFIAGLVMAGLFIGVLWQLFSYIPYEPIDVQGTVILYVTLLTLWGLIFGGLYAFFYDYIPSEGIKKGLIYGMILWIMVWAYPNVIAIMYGFYSWGFQDIIAGFFSTCIVYGSLIGVLYKK